MPVDFLTPEQEQAYARYHGEPPLADLERYFPLDDADRAFIAERRGDHNRLGLGVQLTTVRYLGTFLDDPAAVPAPVVATIAAQLGVDDLACLVRYRAGETRWDHTTAIRQRYGYREFVDQPCHWRFVRWLYARAWTGAERPTALFDQAVARLVADKVLLPGVSVLERLVARVRDRAATRLWYGLARLPDAGQRANLERHRVAALLPDRDADQVAAWLARYPSLQVVSRDRAGLYSEVWIAHERCRNGNFRVPCRRSQRTTKSVERRRHTGTTSSLPCSPITST